MLEKKFSSHSRNTLTLVLFGLVLVIIPISCDYDYCIDWRMKGFYLEPENFEQYGGTGTNVLGYHNFLKKHYHDYPYSAWRESYGNIIEKIDFKRDFHMGFRNYPYNRDYGGSWKDFSFNFGLAIVFSPYKANKYRLENVGNYFLVEDLEKSIVIIFNNYYQQIHILNCLKTPCDTSNPTVYYPYNNLDENKNLFIHIVYSAAMHSITLYQNDYHYENNLLFTYDQVYLTDYLDRGWGYLGITSTDHYGVFFNDIGYTYYCINGGEKITPIIVSLSYESDTIYQNQTIVVPPFKSLILRIEYDNNREAELMGPGIITIDDDPYLLKENPIEKGYTFTYNTESNYKTYKLVYETDYDKFIFYIKVQSAKISSLNYTYGISPQKEPSYTIDGDYRILNYGSLNGDFDLSDFEINKYLYFYVTPIDDFGHEAEIKDISKIKADLYEDSKYNLTLKKVEGTNYIYQIGVPITKKGTYLIYSNYFDKTISFTVKNLIPNKASCKIENYTKIAYNRDKNITFVCEFKDGNDDINIKEAIDIKHLKIDINLYRNDKFLQKIDGFCSGNKCFYNYITEYSGTYKFEAKYGIKEMEIINSNENIFYVSPEPKSLTGCYFYVYDLDLWVNIEKIGSTIFNYYENSEDSDNFLLIDFVDSDTENTKYSEIEQPYIYFDPNQINGTIFDEHSGYKKELSFDIYPKDNKQYILVKLNDSKIEMKRSSLEYKIILDYGLTQNLRGKYFLDDLKGYEACRKNLEINNSIIITTNENSIKAGSLIKMAELILRTDNKHIHNYFLDEDEYNITFNVENNDCKEENSCLIDIGKSNIEGIYNLKFRSNKTGNFKIIGTINDKNLNKDGNSFSVKVESISEAHHLEKTDPTEKDYTVEDEIKFGFKIYDNYNNEINYDLNEGNFGLEYSLYIDDTRANNIKLEKIDDNYYIKETNRKSGKYKIILKTTYSDSKLEFLYDKHPGRADLSFSSLKIITSNKLNLNEESKAELKLYDKYRNDINSDEYSFERVIKNVTIYASNGEDEIIYEQDSKNKNLFVSEPMNKKGKYNLIGLIYGEKMTTCYSCNFEVVDYGYDFSSSQLKMIGEKIIIMKKEDNYNLYKGLQRPAFEFDFMTEQGLPSNEIENDTIIYANITDSKKNDEELEKIWIDKNKILWIIKDKYELKEGEKYTIKVGNNNTEYNYYLSIVNYGGDKSNEDNYKISNTFVSPNILYLKAGISDTFIVEFRDNNNLRYNKPLLKDKLTFINNSNFEIKSKLGNKNGQIIVEVKSTEVCDYTEKCIIKMKYDNIDINTEVQIIVSEGDLDHFEIDDSSFEDKENKILIPGKVGSSTKINLIPYDVYGNKIKDSIFNKKIYSEESLTYLFNLKHDTGYKISLKSSINPVLYFVELSILSEKTGNLYLSSTYLDEKYTMIIEPGSPSKYSVGYLIDKNDNAVAGSVSTFIIEPKDENGNKINDKGIIEKIKNNYNVKIYDLDGNLIVNGINPSYNEEKKVIEYEIENTKSETKVVEAYYNDEEIVLNNNVINVVSGDFYLNNTKLKYSGQEYYIFETLKLSLNNLPIIDLELYDEYENKINISNINNKVELKLIDGENELSDNIIYNKDLRLYIKKITEYFKISKTDNNCKLNLIIENKIEKEVNFVFIDEPPEENKEEEPITFIMDTDDLILKAGEKGIINLSFYTEKGKPMGYFFDNIENIVLTCINDKILDTLIVPGKFYGTYNILISSIFAIETPITCDVIAIDKTQQFSLNIIPNKVVKCQKISETLPDAESGKIFNLNMECFDSYGNKAILEDGNFGALIKNEKYEIFEYNLNLNTDNSISLYFIPTKSGKYSIDSIYLDDPIIVETLPGKISPENSYLEISGNAKAGDVINIDINLFDLYGNKVYLSEEDDNLIFDLYNRYIENSKFSKFEKIEGLPQVLDNKIRYNIIVTKGGFNEFRGIHKNTSTIIKCANCQIKVNSSEFDLENTDVYKFNSFSKSYTKLNQIDVLYNYEEDLFIKIYPKDIYGNKVSTKNLDLRVEIDGNNLDLDNSNEEFLEFHENNGIFSNLTGLKELIICYGDTKIIHFVNVVGKDDFDTDDVKPENTNLLESNLEFSAGKYGYFNFELRNSKNARYNKAFNGEFDIIPGDKNVKVEIYNRNSSTILVLITSKRANIFPNDNEQGLNVTIDSKNVFNLELIIHPGELSSAEINDDYFIGSNKLAPIKADKELIFSIIGYDSYGNKVLINPNDAKIIIKNKYNNEIPHKSSYTDLSNGEQNYEYELTLVGNYNISSGDDKEDLFNGTIYTIEVKQGEICPEKTQAKIEKSPISAGDSASIIVTPKDKYNNDVILSEDEILSQFNAYIISNKYEDIDLDYNSEESSFKYSKKIEKVGKYQFNINYNGRKIKCDKLIVNPAGCEPINTLIYSRDKNGQYILYNKDNYAYSSINSPLYLSLTFRDEYSNIINDINGIQLEEYYLHGNSMEKLYWTYNNGELYLDLSNSNKKKILEHLVTRTNEKAYNFTFTVKNNKNNKNNIFNIKVNHFGKKEDEDKYGNGDYILNKCEVNTNEAEFKAGTTYIVYLTLKTDDELIYNGEFNINYIDCSQLTKEDKSFKCTVSKNDTGIYAIQYYSTLYKERKDEIYNIIELFNSRKDDSRKFPVLLINKFGLPSKEKTNIIKGLENEIKDGEDAKIIFKLYDEFNNLLEAEGIIDDLYFENFDSPIDSNIQYDSSTKEFTAILYIPSNQKYISIQLYYKVDQDNKIDLFKDTEKSQFVYDIDYKKTVIHSRNVKEMKAGDYLELNIITYDKNSQCYIDRDVSSSFSATVQGPLGKSTEKKNYNFKRTIGTSCQYIYKIDINDSNYYTVSGNYLIIVKANEEEIASYEQTVISAEIDKDHFVIYYINMDDKPYNDQNIPAGELIYFMVQAYDRFNNKIDHESLPSELFIINVTPNEGTNIIKYNGGSGALTCIFNNTKAGTFTFSYKYNSEKINPKIEKGPNKINYVAGQCNEEYPQVEYPDENDIDVSTLYKYTIKCLDKYGNEVTKGGAKFTSEVFLYIEESENRIDINSKIDDKGNGTYEISFIPPLLGGYSIYTYLEGIRYDELQFNLTGRICNKTYICPNNKDCVDDLRECIPPENRCDDAAEKEEKPFRCNNSKICIDSMTKCNYEETDIWTRCPYMNTSIPKDKSYLCPYYLPIDCKRKFPSYRTLCADGICRTKKSLQPNQRVCPIGKVLCADLTCKDSVDRCYNDYPECGNTQIRCPDQSCVDDQKDCPTTITCADPKHFVCPDGTCVVNEIYCSRLKTCPEETPYLCTDNSCSTSAENCPHTVACGHGKSLCSDLICRETC